MAPLTVRRIEPEERPAFARSVMIPFLDPARGERLDSTRWQRWWQNIDAQRSWVAEDGGRFVANCTVYTMDVSVPPTPGGSCPALPMGGVSAVGVHPTHRRRGILTAMMTEMLTDCARRAEPIAGLLASESVIYGRYGFGIASESARAVIDSRRARLTVAPPRLDLRLLEPDEAGEVLPKLFERFRLLRAGEPSMRSGAWEAMLADAAEDRPGLGPMMIAAADEGYVIYHFKDGGDDDDALCVRSLWGADAGAEAALWQFLFDIDLTERVEALRRPVDEPLRWRLADPRQLHLTDLTDRLHVRILDVGRAFEARGYAGEGRLVLDVVGATGGSFPGDDVTGTWAVDAGPDGASVHRAGPGDAVDLTLDVAALGTLYMGGFAASALAAAGRVVEGRPGAAALADRLLLTRPLPMTTTGF